MAVGTGQAVSIEMLTLLLRFKSYLFIIGIIGAILGYAWYEHTRFLNIKLEYANFIEQSLALQLQKEKEYAIQLNVAMGMRDNAFKRLRDSENRARNLRASITTHRPIGTCTESATVDAALSQFLADVEGLVIEGDEAIINVKAWADSWPK